MSKNRWKGYILRSTWGHVALPPLVFLLASNPLRVGAMASTDQPMVWSVTRSADRLCKSALQTAAGLISWPRLSRNAELKTQELESALFDATLKRFGSLPVAKNLSRFDHVIDRSQSNAYAQISQDASHRGQNLFVTIEFGHTKWGNEEGWQSKTVVNRIWDYFAKAVLTRLAEEPQYFKLSQLIKKVKMEEGTSQSTEKIEAKYLDYKNLRFVFHEETKKEDVEEKLHQLYRESVQEVGDLLVQLHHDKALYEKSPFEEDLIRGRSLDVRRLFAYGVGKSQMEASYTARKARGLDIDETSTDDYYFETYADVAVKDLKRFYQLHKKLINEFSRSESMRGIGGITKSQGPRYLRYLQSAEASTEWHEMYSSDGRRQAVGALAQQKLLSWELVYSMLKIKSEIRSEKISDSSRKFELIGKRLKQFLGDKAPHNSVIKDLKEYLDIVLTFSPPINILDRPSEELLGTFDLLASIDIKGQNANNITETMRALLISQTLLREKSDASSEQEALEVDGQGIRWALNLVEDGEKVATARLNKLKEKLNEAINGILKQIPALKGIKVYNSGDDFVVGFTFDDSVPPNIMKTILNFKIKSLFMEAIVDVVGIFGSHKLRLTFITDKVTPKLRQDVIGVAEKIEKNLVRFLMQKNLTLEDLNNTVIGVDMEGTQIGKGSFGLLVMGPESEKVISLIKKSMRRWANVGDGRKFGLSVIWEVGNEESDSRLRLRFSDILTGGLAILPGPAP